ncbi:sensor histidine kinase [Trueperella pecoris]|uniref:sensor histidine kinase n=1 Tax=Trueperella pecoris TaxID=2733571 RepID=UPI00186B7DD1|nr:HAMP domain-containing sensor histidine kinase [Trueperella pecoris]QOQ38545.1 HAMP domain-containing histidine kinase [Trueperella pecoris]
MRTSRLLQGGRRCATPSWTATPYVDTAPAATTPGGDEAAVVETRLVNAELDRLAGLVNDMLTLAKTEGKPGGGEELDGADVVMDEARRLRAMGVPAEVYLDYGPVFADPGSMSHIVRNLADNAARHTVGWVRLGVENVERVPFAQGTGWIAIHVDNEGDPIPEADRERVFERFVRLEEHRGSHSGSGLGLAIARTLARTFAGELTAGDDGHGHCRFTLWMPRYDVDIVAAD